MDEPMKHLVMGMFGSDCTAWLWLVPKESRVTPAMPLILSPSRAQKADAGWKHSSEERELAGIYWVAAQHSLYHHKRVSCAIMHKVCSWCKTKKLQFSSRLSAHVTHCWDPSFQKSLNTLPVTCKRFKVSFSLPCLQPAARKTQMLDEFTCLGILHPLSSLTVPKGNALINFKLPLY